MNILIVDDGEPARELLQRILKKEGHHVVAACDGVAALEVLRREPVAVILADIMMPQMDGYRLCQAVRRDEQLKQIPFIIYTANYGSPADERMALDLGADAFLHKPATPATILKTLQRVTSCPRAESPRPPVEPTETEVMQEYSDRLVGKLEQRNNELAQLNKTLSESEARYRLLADAAEDFVTLNDTEGRRLYVSPSYYRVTGWTPEEIQSTDWRARQHADDLPQIERTRAANLAGETTTIEHRVRCRDGRWIWVESRCKPVLGREGKVEQLMVWGRDITERKHVEADLQASQRMLQLILDNIPQGVFWKDRESRYLGCNAVVARTFGAATATALKGKSDSEIGPITPEQAALFVQKDREVMASNRPQLGIIEQSTFADGRTRWLETNKLPLQSPTGEVIGVLGTWQDITERKLAEEVLQRRTADLERFHRLSVGRELQMIDLKKEINALAQQAGRPPPHDLSFLESAAPTKAQS